ncbi:hypothetical protein Q5P01_002244 [Channa striata]|uniref:Ig-like domain-containing protein n=1 Tax=Channa striata TaxID=64152 RepID=A0AA88T3J7_CHASR|nr:hypothetical protein Q5P01_002244 [Channa striata]
MITDLQISDSASYYCARRLSGITYFFDGTVVSVNGSGLTVPALVHQSESRTTQPGGSVTLSCTVHTGTCDGEHSVYWFKDSNKSLPKLIYTHGDRNSRCERKPETKSHTCFHNLPVKNLSQAGTYHCAVASCGHILFGNRSKLEYETDSLVMVYVLSGSLTLTTILIVLLAFLLYKIQKKSSISESQVGQPSPSTTSEEYIHDAVNLHYAALSVTRPYRSRTQQRDLNSECVYSRVKL